MIILSRLSPDASHLCNPSRVTEVQTDEYGVEETVTVLQPAPLERYSKQDVFVPPVLAKWLRPHQREGVHFMYQCVMGLKDYDGNGVILADDMGKHWACWFSSFSVKRFDS